MAEKKNEETEPEAMHGFVDATPEGTPGQIEYPEAQVNPERAGLYAAGKTPFLYDADAEREEIDPNLTPVEQMQQREQMERRDRENG